YCRQMLFTKVFRKKFEFVSDKVALEKFPSLLIAFKKCYLPDFQSFSPLFSLIFKDLKLSA
ncbi:MAG TPA: hypothetical protein DEA44_05095, partial [Firmicutes bacterium]|nr:hypothetical protein [Bacillota bacterium]